jgi:flagellar FliJ protein
MANLKSLIKLRKHTVDEKQKNLANLYSLAEDIEKKKTLLINRLQEERSVITHTSPLEMLAYFGRFSQNVQRILEKMNVEKRKVEERIVIAQDDVRNAFAEMKRIEIVQREREKADKKKQDAKEVMEMDDIAIEGFTRREEDSL